MDDRAFDTMIRTLAAPTSRRRMVVGLLSTLAAGAVGRSTSAKSRHQGRRHGGGVGAAARLACTTNQQCSEPLAPGSCLIATCTKDTATGKTRCAYQRDPALCTDPGKPVCCNYGTPHGGQCVAKGTETYNQYCQ